jgi:hypothetical protein
LKFKILIFLVCPGPSRSEKNQKTRKIVLLKFCFPVILIDFDCFELTTQAGFGSSFPMGRGKRRTGATPEPDEVKIIKLICFIHDAQFDF